MNQFIIDFHVHPKHSHPVEAVVVEMERLGVAHSVILANDRPSGFNQRPEIVEEFKNRFLNSQFALSLGPSRSMNILSQLEKRFVSSGSSPGNS